MGWMSSWIKGRPAVRGTSAVFQGTLINKEQADKLKGKYNKTNSLWKCLFSDIKMHLCLFEIFFFYQNT